MNLFKKHKKFEEQLNEHIGDMEVKPSTSLWDRIDSNITNDSFEAGMQNSLENFEQMPYPETWDKIAAELPEGRVSNGLFRYYVVAAFAVLFASGIYIGNRLKVAKEKVVTNESIAGSKTQVEEPILIPADKAAVNTLSESSKTVTYMPSANNPNVSQKLTARSNNLVTHNSIVHQPAPAKTIAVRKNIIGKKEGAPKSGNERQVNTNQPNTAALAVVAPVLSQPIADVVQGEANISQPVENESAPAQHNVVQAPNNTVPPSVNNSVTPSNDQQTENSKQPLAIVKQETPHPEAREIVATTPDSSLLAQKVAAINQLPAADELTKFSLSVYAGAFMCYTTYAIPSSATLPFDENVKLRKQLERPAMDWSGGITIDYRLNQKWMISGGLMMVNFNQEFNYDISTAAQPANPNEIGAPVTNPSDSFIVGNKYSNRIKYSWTEIPLLVNYTIRNGKRFDIDLQAGASYAFVNTIDGGMVSYDNKGVLILTSKESFPYIQNTVFASVMPQVSYKFGQAVSVGLAPTVKYSLTSIIGNDHWIQQHPYFIGMNICLRKRF